MGDDADTSNKLKVWQYIILVAVLLLGFFVVYKIHFSYNDYIIRPHGDSFIFKANNEYYPYPYHADEWAHLASAEYIINEGKIANVNPYLQQYPHSNLESGFDSFLAEFFLITSLDPLQFYQFLPAFFMMLIMASLFLFVYTATKNFFISILAPSFLLLIRNNINLMGVWFFLPMIFSLFLIFMFFATYFSEGKIRYLSILIFFGAMFSYPLSGIIILSVTLIYELLRVITDREYRKNLHMQKILSFKYLKYVILGIAALAIASMVILRGYFIEMFHGNFIELPFIFKYGWTINFEHTYTPIEIYGWIATILAIVGIIFVLIKRLNKIFIAWPIVFIIPILMYSLLKFTILIPYQRAFFFAMIGLAPLSAIGVYYIYVFFYSIFSGINKNDGNRNNRRNSYDNEHKKRIARIGSAIIIVILLSITFAIGFSNYYKVDDGRFRLVQYTQEKDVSALEWTKAHYAKNTLMMIDLFTSFISYPISNMQVTSVPPSNLAVGNNQDVQTFFYGTYPYDCQSKYGILNHDKPRLVYSYIQFSCTYLREVYNKDGIYIYEVTY